MILITNTQPSLKKESQARHPAAATESEALA
jgi:hypothetical protein